MKISTEKQLCSDVMKFLKGKGNHTLADTATYITSASCLCCGEGIYFYPDKLYTTPGSYLILGAPGEMNGYTFANDLRPLGLDFLYDMSDTSLNRIRAIVVKALDKKKVDFLPVSYSAFYRAVQRDETITLVDREGLECVFKDNQERYFISGYDKNENPPLYFLARLPGKVKTYAEAIESLKPKSVKLAEKKGLKVLRQGDMFAIPTRYRDSDLEKMKALVPLISNRGLYGTNHFAERSATLPDGTMLGSGTIFHRPPNRNPDHADLKLFKDRGFGPWFLIVKNTVPIQGRG